MLSQRPLVWFCAFCSLITTAAGQDFILENPAEPAGASLAAIIGTDLVVTDAGGRQFVYQRRPDLDTLDGEFQGFYSAAAAQYLRWPVSGTGNMQVGRGAGGAISWNVSRMQVRMAAGGPVEADAFIPGGPISVSTLPLGPNTTCAAEIDGAGQLQFFIGHGERWRHFAADHPPGLFIPGAPVQLIPEPGAPVPRVLTIGAQGRFLSVTGGKVVVELPEAVGIKCVPGSHFTTVQTPAGIRIVTADRHGRLRLIELNGGKNQIIEGHLGVLEPGIPIAAMRDGRDLFMTDRHGAVVVYSQDDLLKWNGPAILAGGFTSAGAVTAWYHPGSTDVELAAVDQEGHLQVLRLAGGKWVKSSVPGVTLPAGSPVTAFETKAGLSLTAVLSDGRWMEFFETAGKWQERLIAPGFPSRAPLAFSGFGPMLFATDLTGRLVSAIWTGTEWRSVICIPADFLPGQIVMAPRLISRKTIINRQIDPVTVQLQNSTPEELVVRVQDSRIPGKVQEYVLPPNGSTAMPADRDAGGTLEEVYLVPGPGGPIQQVRQIPLPPRQFYDLVVYANRVTYQYIDRRKQKGPVPDFNESSLISLGAFPLPPGPLLKNGTRLDVFRIATMTNNPGAAAVLDPMSPQP